MLDLEGNPIAEEELEILGGKRTRRIIYQESQYLAYKKR